VKALPRNSPKEPDTPRAKKVLELSLRESLNLGHNHIGTEHILLGLTRENEGVATHILLHFDANADTIRNTTRETLAGSGGRWSADVKPGRRPQTPVHDRSGLAARARWSPQ
jgi:ATP-dependent Clp protease ATP-binding subunit ClpC